MNTNGLRCRPVHGAAPIKQKMGKFAQLVPENKSGSEYLIDMLDKEQQLAYLRGLYSKTGYIFDKMPERASIASTLKWDLRFLDMARLVSTWSKDPSTQTGAVIVDEDRRVVSVGYNGFARGVEDTEERWNNREVKYALVVHCERNAMLFARQDLTGCTLYTWPFMSCSVCAGMVIQTGIVRHVAPDNPNPRWVDSFKLSIEQFKEAGVKVELIPGLVAQ